MILNTETQRHRGTVRKIEPNGSLVRGALKALCLCVSVLGFLSGCQSYTIVQQNYFSDDDGNVVRVDYGRSDSDHVNTFVSPATGKEMDFKSKLMVKVTLPDGDTIKAWQCMNFLSRGTMYESDGGEWKVLANGFSTVIYHRTGEPPPRDYLEVYRGVICETSELKEEKNDKWRDVTHQGMREYRRPASVKK